MNRLVLDLETTVQDTDGKIDGSPFNPANRCVSAHYGWLTDTGVEEVTSLVFFHNDKDVPDDIEVLRKVLLEADCIIAHNLNFDAQWLREMGLELPATLRCTMISEYILARGQRKSLSLKETAKRRECGTQKKSDLVSELFEGGTGYEAMPLQTVLEYAEADVKSCGDVFLSQEVEFDQEDSKSLRNIVALMNEMLLFCLEVETNGLHFDKDVLEGVKQELVTEQADLRHKLTDIGEQVMGDEPFNLASGKDLSKLVYSREVKSRDDHVRTFNLGLLPNGRNKRPPRMNKSQFAGTVRSLTTIAYRKDASCCPDCNGRGFVQKFKKVTRQRLGKKYITQGDPYKNPSRCKVCKGAGAIYTPTGKVAGLKLSPLDVSYASVNGFKTSKDILGKLIDQAQAKDNLLAVDFLQSLIRLNAVSTYLDSFVKGIEVWTRGTSILHTNLNQCITATGRLSSSRPNLQNAPKKGFPVRKAVTSRFKDGLVVEADFSGIEFRVAGELSRDGQIISDINSGKDIHRQTASIIHQKPPEDISSDVRGQVKMHTFAPLYGASGMGQMDHVRLYYEEFFNIYKGLKSYQKRLMDGVIQNGIVQTPSGRQYYWPNAKRLGNGRCSDATQVVNWPIQGHATGDLVVLACVRALRLFKERKLKSLIVLSVHDSIVVDTVQDEKDIVCETLREAMVGVTKEAEERWGHTYVLPLDIEISSGTNWLQQHEIKC